MIRSERGRISLPSFRATAYGREGRGRVSLKKVEKAKREERKEKDATHSDDGTEVTLQVVPVVSVVRSNELVLWSDRKR